MEGRDSRSERPERVTIDAKLPGRGRSQQRRVPLAPVRPTAQDGGDDENDDHDLPPRSRPRPASAQYIQPLAGEMPSSHTRSYATFSRRRRVPDEEDDQIRDGQRFSYGAGPPMHRYLYRGQPMGRDYGLSPNFPRRTADRTSFGHPRPDPPSDAQPPEEIRLRRSRRPHHSTETIEVEDDDGGHYDRPTSLPNRLHREADPTPECQRLTTSNYYDGSGERAWTRKNNERSGRFGPPPEEIININELAPQNPR